MDDAAICLSRRWPVKRAHGSGCARPTCRESVTSGRRRRETIGVHVICFRRSGGEGLGALRRSRRSWSLEASELVRWWTRYAEEGLADIE